MQKELEQIARDVLGIETLETRNSDRLDFHDVAVWSIRDALAKAYEAGRKSLTQGAGNPGKGSPLTAGGFVVQPVFTSPGCLHDPDLSEAIQVRADGTYVKCKHCGEFYRASVVMIGGGGGGGNSGGRGYGGPAGNGGRPHAVRAGQHQERRL